jgi:rhodanese-related sulfurtransferase
LTPTDDFTNLVYERPASTTQLPEITFDNSVSGINEKIMGRIQSLMSLSFGDPAAFTLSTDLSGLSFIYNKLDSTFTNTFIVCFGHDGLYILGSNGDLTAKGHPPSSVFYMQSNGYYSDLRSTSYLQTIPSSKDIVVYSKYGHSSAFVVAYLRLLGYNAKSLLFGAGWRESLPGAYLQNYPYDTGN